MAQKKLILHVGLHKTATSSFQKTCGDNRKELKRQGIHFPLFTLDNRKINNHSIPIFSLFCEKPERYNVNIKWGYSDRIEYVNAIYRRQLERALDSESTVLLSGEDISVLSPSGLMALRDYLIEKGFDLRVLCSVRKPYSFTCSEIQQKVRGGIVGNIQGAKVPQKSVRIRALKEIFEHVEFSSFETDCRHPNGPVSALLDTIGADRRKIIQADLNEGLGNITTRLYAGINKEYPIIYEGKLNPLGRDRDVINFDPNKFLLTAEELATVKAALDAENREFERLLGGAFTDEGYPTSSPFYIDLDLATKMLIDASRPPHVKDAVERFLVKHSDNSWELPELLKVAAVEKPGNRSDQFESQGRHKLARNIADLIRSAVQIFR